MADEENLNIRISELPETNVVDKDTDYLPVVKESTLYTSGYQTFKVTPAKLLAEAAEYTAGDHIAISSDNEISATYKAGTNITISADGTISATGGGSGSTVEVTQIQTTGTKIATITVDSVGTDLYAPNGGGGASAFEDLTDVDIDSSTLANGQVPVYNSNSAKWENGTISSGSGHTILDDEGTSLTQRDDLQFKGAYSEDDSTNEKTVVNVARTMTLAEFEQLTDDEKAGFINVEDETSGSDDKFQPVIYSETEREIGVWTDGKPLYEKTYHQTSLSITPNTELTIDDFSDRFPVSCTGVMHCTDGRTYYPSWAYGGSSNYNIYYKKKDDGTLVLSSENDTWGNTWEIFTVVRYTKDSDTAGSGQWTPQGVPAVHYSTDEQVIGTWIDGSTLYEKTIVGDDTYNQQFNYIPHGVTNLDKIIDYFGYCYYGGTDFSLIPYLRGSTYITVTVWDSTNIRVEKTGLSNSFTGVRLVIRYTKSST